MKHKKFIAIVQCEKATKRCPGYQCDRAFVERTGGFKNYPLNQEYRKIHFTCGGCPGDNSIKKAQIFLKKAKKSENFEKEDCVVHFATCISKSNFHSKRCENIENMKNLFKDAGIDTIEDTKISSLSEKRRAEGVYS